MDKELQEFVDKQKEIIISSYEQAKSYSILSVLYNCA